MSDAQISITVDGLELADGAFTRLRDGFASVREAADTVASRAGDSFNGLLGKLGDLGAGVQLAIENPLGAAGMFAEDFGSTVANAFEHPMDAVKALGSAVHSEIIQVLGPELGPVVEIATAAIGGLAATFMSLGERATDVGAEIRRVALVTGQSVPAASALKFAIEAAGGSFDQINNSMFMFEQRMENSSEKVNEGLKLIGTSLGQIGDMSRDQQLLAISDAFRGAGDDVNKAAAAMDIFGRQGRDMLPMLLKPLSDLADKSKDLGATWSEDDAKAAGAFKQEMRELDSELSAAWMSLGRDVAPVTEAIALAFKELKVHGEEALIWLLRWGTGVGELKTIYEYSDAAWQMFFGQMSDIPKVAGPATDALKKQEEAIRKNAASADDFHMSGAQLKLTIDGYKEQMVDAKTKTDDFGKAMIDLNSAGGSWRGTLDSIDGTLEQAAEYYLRAGVSASTLMKVYGLTEAQMKAVEASIKDQTEAQKTHDKVIELESSPSLENFSDKLRKLGTAVPQSFFDSIDATYTKLAKIENAAPGIGEAMEKMGRQPKPSMDDYTASLTKAQRVMLDIQLDAQKLPDMLIQAFTGGGNISGAINGLLTQTTKDLFGEKGPLASVTHELGHAVTDATGFLGKALSGTLGSVVSGILPGVGGLVTSAVGALFSMGGPSKDELAARDTFGQFQKQFGSFEQMMNAVGDAYVKAGKSGTDAMNDVNRALQATHHSASDVTSALNVIQNTMNTAQQDQDDLTAAVKKYNFSVAELGPTMKAQQLSQQAAQLERDFTLLNGSGITLNTTLDHMAPAINDFVNTAISAGSEIPSEMQPILQKMMDTGQLIDSNGNKITDFKTAGITFSESMTQGFQKVVDKLNDLLVGLGIKLPDAINSVPKHLNIDVGWNVDAPPAGLSIDTGDVQSFANEGYDIGRPTRAIVGDSPFSNENVLRTSTVKDLVRAARNSGGTPSSSALEAKLDRLGDTLQGYHETLTSMMRTQPSRFAAAIAGTR